MNIYARYFDRDILVKNIDELIDFLSSISDIHVTQELVEDIRTYVNSDITYPKRYKIRPRVYFILIKTEAGSIEEFQAHKKEEATAGGSATDKKEQRSLQLTDECPGWYKGTINFKRVVQNPETGKFKYEDTTFSALVKADSGQQCYNRIVAHLKSREDVDLRSQFPSVKGNNFHYTRVADFNEKMPEMQ